MVEPAEGAPRGSDPAETKEEDPLMQLRVRNKDREIVHTTLWFPKSKLGEETTKLKNRFSTHDGFGIEESQG